METAEALKLHDSRNNPKGKAFLIIKEFLELKLFIIFVSRIPISKIPLFRELLEENGFRLTDQQRMSL